MSYSREIPSGDGSTHTLKVSDSEVTLNGAQTTSKLTYERTRSRPKISLTPETTSPVEMTCGFGALTSFNDSSLKGQTSDMSELKLRGKDYPWECKGRWVVPWIAYPFPVEFQWFQ